MNKANKITQELERKGYKFRLIVPNSIIERKLNQIVCSCRFVWNKALALIKQDDVDHKTIIEMFKLAGATDAEVKTVSREFKFNPYQQLSKMLTEWKQQPETAFLSQSYSKSLQITQIQLWY